uniref:U24-Sparatoxin-Hju1n_1 n=1 Tax=Heteropoda jugulans TaxID=1358901 RepID=A0A4Q8K425_9ARAC
MKIALVVTLLFVAFSAVTLAEKSIEDAALDLVEVRPRRVCGQWFDDCDDNKKCCEHYKCRVQGYCYPEL